MNTQMNNNWDEANQRYLSAALALVRQELERHLAHARNQPFTDEQLQLAKCDLDEASAALPAPASLMKLCAAFDLSPFERDLLLLCAGMELESTFATLCAPSRDHEEGRAHLPTFSLALAALSGAHWDALTPSAPLRRWQLISVGSGSILTFSPLRIDERILHYLVGVSQPDARLTGMLVPVPAPAAHDLAPSHQTLAARLTAAWRPAIEQFRRTSLREQTTSQSITAIQLCGEDGAGKQALAAAVCHALGLRANVLQADALPTRVGEIETLARLYEREAVLGDNALLLNCNDADMADAGRTSAIARFLQQLQSPCIIMARERFHLAQPQAPQLLIVDVQKPGMSEQRQLWQDALDTLSLNGHIDALASQFNLSASSIRSASAEVVGNDGVLLPGIEHPGDALWDACRVQARPRLDDLAQHIESRATWDDLVLPGAQHEILREMAAHVRQRATVYERWGFSEKGTRGLGISALFAGASGTGKTLAAEVLAHELRLDLYRIDLSSVVSKYIGETEKNLRRVFDAAEEGGAVLLFDEADALFGKRSEVKDSHDRYANIEVGYLLQRMEAYRGLAVLTTNLKSSLDTAFTRRIRFIVHFPFPDAAQRAEIWRCIYPERTPTERLDFDKLARLNVSGGNIRNIALNAAFLAADAHEPVRMTHLLRAVGTEYAKLEKPLTEAEIGGWL